MFTIFGTGVGEGIAIGRARVIEHPGEEVPEYAITREDVAAEISRYAEAVSHATEGLRNLKVELPTASLNELAAFIDAHMLMIEDRQLSEEPKSIIAEQLINAEAALRQQQSKIEAVFGAMEDSYLRSKTADVQQAAQRIYAVLQRNDDLSEQPEGAFDGDIIVANDLTPADTITLRKHRLSGFLTNLGGPVSHTAILARSLRIPAIVGMHGALRYIRNGDLLIVDGRRGIVLIDPDATSIASYQRRMAKILRRQQQLQLLKDADTVTIDGTPIKLLANIELPEELVDVAPATAAGVGLYRTEFLFMNRHDLPDEEEQFAVYREIVSAVSGEVNIRTLDLGADKQVDGGRLTSSRAINPAMGLRAIRLCLHELDLFRPQLRAIYRAAVYGQVKITIPMISSLAELQRIRQLTEEVKAQLRQEGVDFQPDIPIGAMIEVPAAAIAAELFARELDFLSIGTNDLIQYTLAVDRVDDDVNYLYDPLHPAVLRLIAMVIKAGDGAGIPVSMCGEMAGDTEYTRVLLGLGLREFSMDPAVLLAVKQQICLSDIGELQEQVKPLLRTADGQKSRALLTTINE